MRDSVRTAYLRFGEPSCSKLPFFIALIQLASEPIYFQRIARKIESLQLIEKTTEEVGSAIRYLRLCFSSSSRYDNKEGKGKYPVDEVK